MSFRLKTILGIALLQAIVLALLVWLATYYLDSWTFEAVNRRAQETSQLFATMSKDAVISTDLATLEEMVAEVAALPEVAYVQVSDTGGILSSRGASDSRTGSSAPDPAVLNTVAVIEAAGHRFGEVSLGFNLAVLRQRLDEVRLQLTLVAAVGLVLLILASWWLGAYLTRRLVSLQQHAMAVARGDTRQGIEVCGSDELAVTARAFNTMLESLEAEQCKLGAKMAEVQALSDLNSRNEQYLRTVLESVSDGIITLDSGGRISRINTATEQLFGYSENELMGQEFSVLIANPDWRSLDSDSVPIEGIGREVSALRKDGTVLPVDLSVSSMILEGERCFVGLLRDLTLNHQMAAEIRRSGKIKSMIADASMDALVTIDPQGHIVEFNTAAEQLYGWTREQMLGRLMEDYLIPEEMRHRHSQGMALFAKTGTGPLIGNRVEVETLCADGQRIPIELSLVATDIDGERLATAFIRDIRDRKQAECQLIEAKVAAEQASQAKSRFLSHMSHEIRSPLNAVLGAVNLIADRADNPEQLELLRTAQGSGAALLAVINEVLDFSRIEAGHLQLMQAEQDIAELMDDVLSAAQARLVSPELELICSIEPEATGGVMTDPVRLRQIINILVDNALKFTETGLIWVRAQRTQTEDLGDQLRIRVSDTGVGIPAEQQAVIFEEFEQVDATRDTGYGGTGLGLTIARRLVELLGGTLGVTSEPGEGSCFYFTVPVVYCDNAVATPPVCNDQVIIVSANAALLAAFSIRLAGCVGALEGLSDMSSLQGKVNGLSPVQRARTRLIIDESLLSESGVLALPGWLEDWPLPIAIMTRIESEWPVSGAYRLTKPLSCRRVYEYLISDGVTRPVSTAAGPVDYVRRQGRVLLVEDVAANRLVAGELLKRHGLDVVQAVDGLDALDKAEETLFDVILMDVRMPRLNGIEAVRKLRQGEGANALTPVIALTANAESSEIDRCLAAGMNDFISKPFDNAHLFARVEQYCNEAVQPESDVATNVPVSDAFELLERGVLDKLARDTSEDMLPMMLDTFIDELAQRRDDVAEAIRNRHRVSLLESAHALKSCAGTFGARHLQHRAQGLERLCLKKDEWAGVMKEAPNMLDALHLTLARYRAFCEQLKAKY